MLTHKAMYSTTLPFMDGRLHGKKIKTLRLKVTLTCTTKFRLTLKNLSAKNLFKGFPSNAESKLLESD